MSFYLEYQYLVASVLFNNDEHFFLLQYKKQTIHLCFQQYVLYGLNNIFK